MVATAFEHRVNEARGYSCLCITAASCWIVGSHPRCLLFWRPDAYALISARTGMLGLATSAFFLLYLAVDTLLGIVCRHNFRRSMNAVFVHHLVVGVALASFLLPSPPRGLFLYVLGEALTACRLLPPGPRWHARSAVFAGRRCLWLYLLCRDVYLFDATAQRFGTAVATLPPLVSILLLGLDCIWWREHSRNARFGAAGHKHAPLGEERRGANARDAETSHTSEDESGRLLLSPAGASSAGRAPRSPEHELPASTNATAFAAVATAPSTPSTTHALSVDIEAPRNASYDDRQTEPPNAAAT